MCCCICFYMDDRIRTQVILLVRSWKVQMTYTWVIRNQHAVECIWAQIPLYESPSTLTLGTLYSSQHSRHSFVPFPAWEKRSVPQTLLFCNSSNSDQMSKDQGVRFSDCSCVGLCFQQLRVFFFWDSFVRFKDIPWILNFMLCFTTVDFRECEQSFSQKLKIISFCLLKIVISFAQFLSPFYKAAEISYVLWRSVQNTFKETVKGLEPWLSG